MPHLFYFKQILFPISSVGLFFISTHTHLTETNHVYAMNNMVHASGALRGGTPALGVAAYFAASLSTGCDKAK